MHEAEGILYLLLAGYSSLNAFHHQIMILVFFPICFSLHAVLFIVCVSRKQVDWLGMCSRLTKTNTAKMMRMLSCVAAL